MANNTLISLSAASLLAISFTMTGCGNTTTAYHSASSEAVSSVSSIVEASSSSEVVVISSSVSSEVEVSSSSEIVVESSSSVEESSSSEIVVESSSSIEESSSSEIVVESSSSEEASSSSEIVVESSSSEASSEASSSSEAAAPTIRVSDAYVIDADVTAGGVAAVLYTEDGVYEWNVTISGDLESIGGANDLAAPYGEATSADPMAPNMMAPAGYENINPLTTLLQQSLNGTSNVTLVELLSIYPVAANLGGVDKLFDFDVVAESANNLDLAKEIAKAALAVSGYDGSTSSSVSSAEESSEAASSEESSEMTESSAAVSSLPFPAPVLAADCVKNFPGDCDGVEDSSSSEEATSSEAESSEMVSSESVSSAMADAYAEIDACVTQTCLDTIVFNYQVMLNGYYTQATASSSSESETCGLPGTEPCSSSSDEEASSSSAASSGGECILLPGQPCTTSSESSSEEASSEAEEESSAAASSVSLFPAPAL